MTDRFIRPACAVCSHSRRVHYFGLGCQKRHCPCSYYQAQEQRPPMTKPIDLDEMKARLAAYPVPKTAEAVGADFDGRVVVNVELRYTERDALPMTSSPYADLIAHAPGDLAALVAEVERLRAVAEAARDLLHLSDDIRACETLTCSPRSTGQYVPHSTHGGAVRGSE